MEEIYTNVDRSDSSNQKRSHCRGIQASSSKCNKVLLSVSLVLALGVLGVQGTMYGDEELLHRDKRDTNCPSSCNKFKNPACDACTDGWIEHRGKCYFFSSKKHTWFESRDSCVAAGAHLVTINKKGIQDFLVSKIKESHWIGLNDLDTEGRWVWGNKQTLNETGVQFWYTRKSGLNEPDNQEKKDPSGENCASMGNKKGNVRKWFDNSCKDQKRFICQFKHAFPRPDDI